MTDCLVMQELEDLFARFFATLSPHGFQDFCSEHEQTRRQGFENVPVDKAIGKTAGSVSTVKLGSCSLDLLTPMRDLRHWYLSSMHAVSCSKLLLLPWPLSCMCI